MYEKLVTRLRKAAGPAIDFPDTLYDQAADVVEVRHGSWQFEIDENMSWCTKAICTSCKQVVADNADLTQTWGKGLFLHDNLHCPRCGAVMDGGQDA